jgi:hypothetical protein
LCERGIPRKYWSERPVAGEAAEWGGVEELKSSRVEEGMLVGCVRALGSASRYNGFSIDFFAVWL